MDRNDPQTIQDTNSIQVNIHGIDPAKTQQFRNLIADKFPDWTLTPVNASDYRMNMKPTALLELKRNTVQQSVRDDRAPGERARAYGADGSGSRRIRQRNPKFWSNCRAWTIRRG